MVLRFSLWSAQRWNETLKTKAAWFSLAAGCGSDELAPLIRSARLSIISPQAFLPAWSNYTSKSDFRASSNEWPYCDLLRWVLAFWGQCLCFLNCWSWLTADIDPVCELLDLLKLEQFFSEIVRIWIKPAFLGVEWSSTLYLNLRLRCSLISAGLRSPYQSWLKESPAVSLRFSRKGCWLRNFPASFDNSNAPVLQEVRLKQSHVFAPYQNQIEIVRLLCIMSNQGCYRHPRLPSTISGDFFANITGSQTIFWVKLGLIEDRWASRIPPSGNNRTPSLLQNQCLPCSNPLNNNTVMSAPW